MQQLEFLSTQVRNGMRGDTPKTSSAPPLRPHSSSLRLSRGTLSFSPNCGLESVDLLANSDKSGGKYVDGDEMEV